MIFQKITSKLLKNKSFIDSGSVLIDQGLMSLATFIIGVLVARSVSVDDYGIFVLGWSLVLTIQGIQRGLVVLPFTVYCPKMSASEKGQHLGNGLIHTLILGLISLALFTLATAQNTDESSELGKLLQALPLISLVILPFLLREQLRSTALAKLDFLGSAKSNISASLLIIAGATLLYQKQLLTLNNAYILIALISFFASLLLLYRQKSHLKIKIRALWPDLKHNFKIGKWILINAITYTLLTQAYPWLLLWFQDQSTVAAYGACLAIAGALNPLLRGVTTYALPRMSHGHNDNPEALMRMLWKTVTILAIPFSLWTILGSIFAEQIMNFFYTDKYAGYGLVLSLLILKTLIESLSAPLISALQAIHRPDINTGSLAIGALITITLGTYLTKEFGLIGVGIAAVSATLITSLWRLYFIRKLYKDTV